MKMMVLFSLLVLSVFVFAETPTTNAHPDKVVVQKKAQTQCPILGNAIDKKVYADHKGKRVYFCCSGCISEFKKDPDAFIKKMEAEGIELEKVSSKSK